MQEPEPERGARYRDLFLARHDHADNCAYCPICTGIGVFRSAQPDVVDHLAGAARELISALRVVLEQAEGVLAAVEDASRAPVEDPQPASEPESDAVVRRLDVG